ncbi:MAG: hypothetical protein FJ297_12790 [Planctomycetes bacterium]|nr:hypothetical protein [Planctomycetota bacterium]
MSTWEDRTECPDCRGGLQPIKIVDATDRAMGSGVGHVELGFATRDAAQSGVTASIPRAGVVKAKLCSKCGRIFLYSTSTAGGLPVG